MISGPVRVKTMSEREYRELPLLSSSDIRLFDKDRRKFYKTRILGETVKEKYERAKLIGSVVHTMLLEEEEEFDSKFYLSTCTNVPTANMLLFTEALFNHTVENMGVCGKVTVPFEELCKAAYEESGYKITLPAVLGKFAKSGEEYYTELLEAKKSGLDVVTMDDIAIANRISDIARNDRFVGHLFQDKDRKLNEVKVEGFEVEGVKMKGMLDKVVPDHKNKRLQLYDLKVTYEVQNFFYEYFLGRRADIQGLIYYEALESGLADLGFDYKYYEILPPIFLVIDSTCFYKPLQYQMTSSDLVNARLGFMRNDRYYKGLQEICEDLAWATENNEFTITREDYLNKGIKLLK